jgi:hypothetical protein
MAIAKIEMGNGGGGAEGSALEGRHKVGQQLESILGQIFLPKFTLCHCREFATLRADVF